MSDGINDAYAGPRIVCRGGNVSIIINVGDRDDALKLSGRIAEKLGVKCMVVER